MTTDLTTTSGATAPSSAEPDDQPMAVMSLVDHLSELRSRIFKMILAVAGGSVIGLIFNREIRNLLLTPLPTQQVQVLSPGDAFSITLRIAIIAGFILAMPVILYQAWAFIAPGLTERERKAIRPWVPLSLLFFALGVAIAWVVLPLAVHFLLSFTDDQLVANLAAGPYFGFIGMLFLGIGVAMQYPIVLYALARVGIVSSAQLRRSRRYVILIIAIVAAALTPPDAFSQIVLGVVMYALFEVTLLAITRSGH
ncbi:twin-arginine translocase subunit TatC [soil metagenome]